ncbi:MAG: hypothetical protein QXQ28_07380 [Candidatus Nezhaarchaeales archaeon]
MEDAISTFIGGAAGLITSLLFFLWNVYGWHENQPSKLLLLYKHTAHTSRRWPSRYGTYELIEYYKESGFQLGYIAEPVFNLGISADNPFHHKGMIGSIFAVMFSYSVSPEWGKVVAHSTYLVTIVA